MKTARFGLEMALVQALSAAVGPMSMAAVRRCGAAWAAWSTRSTASTADIALDNLAHAFPSRTAQRAARARRATCSRISAALLLELLKVGPLSQAEMLRLIEFEGEERVRQAYAQGRACCSSPAISATGRCRRIAQPLVRLSRCRCWRGRSTIPACTSCSSASARAPATR